MLSRLDRSISNRNKKEERDRERETKLSPFNISLTELKRLGAESERCELWGKKLTVKRNFSCYLKARMWVGFRYDDNDSNHQSLIRDEMSRIQETNRLIGRGAWILVKQFRMTRVAHTHTHRWMKIKLTWLLRSIDRSVEITEMRHADKVE